MARLLNIIIYRPYQRPQKRAFPVAIENWLAKTIATVKIEQKSHRDLVEFSMGGISKDDAIKNLLEVISKEKNVPVHKLRFKSRIIEVPRKN